MRCFTSMNEPAAYLGLLESTYRGITLLLHAYQVEGELHTSYSAVGPRQNVEDPHVLLPKEEQWAPMARRSYSRLDAPVVSICCFCSEEIPVGPAVFVPGLGLLHTSCFAVPE